MAKKQASTKPAAKAKEQMVLIPKSLLKKLLLHEGEVEILEEAYDYLVDAMQPVTP